MEMLGEMSSSSMLSAPVVQEPPAVGPGGLKNMSALSRKAAASGKQKPVTVRKQRKPPAIEEVAPPAPAPAPLRAPRREAPPPPPDACTKNGRRIFGLAAIAAHMSASRALGGAALPVALSGGVALLVSLRHHDDAAALAKCRNAPSQLVRTLRVQKIVVEGTKLVHERCPATAKKLAVAVAVWRLAGFVLGYVRAVAYLRSALVALASLAACFAYLPLHDLSRRGTALGKVIGFGFVAWAALVVLDLIGGHDATPGLVAAAWLGKPSVDALELKRAKLLATPDKRKELALRSRNLVVAVLAADVDPATDHVPTKLYLGFFGAWFVAARRPKTAFSDPDPYFERLE